MSWLIQFFLNPAFVLPGAALVSVPILIHILSRLRYKRVRFAAMEFLLESEELNRRRIIRCSELLWASSRRALLYFNSSFHSLSAINN